MKREQDVPALIEIPAGAFQRDFPIVEGVIGTFVANVKAHLDDVRNQYDNGQWIDQSMTESRAVNALRTIVLAEGHTVEHFLMGLSDAALHPRHAGVRKLIVVHKEQAPAVTSSAHGAVRYILFLVTFLSAVHRVLMTDPSFGARSSSPHENVHRLVADAIHGLAQAAR
jgi:hypothetical protein